MKFTPLKILLIAACTACTLFFCPPAAAQSTDQNFPSPITTNEISGTIKVRDVGDARLTSYFYVFDGDQGDIFINVVTKNFSGDIDVFTADALRPMTKMVIYADAGLNETGRLIYLRKGERLLLRIEGRSPNDDPATFRIKFGGSFVALAAQKADEAPAVSRAAETEETGVRVNSVGTIIPPAPKPPVGKKPLEVVGNKVTANVPEETKSNPDEVKAEPTPVEKTENASKGETVFENKAAKVTVESATTPEVKVPPRVKPPPKPTKASAKTSKPPARAAPKAAEKPKVDPLASIRLVVQLKDGNVIERPMNEVLKFSVDKGMLTVILKDGKITRYSILDVAKVTIE